MDGLDPKPTLTQDDLKLMSSRAGFMESNAEFQDWFGKTTMTIKKVC